MKKIIHEETYVCDYCGKEHFTYRTMFAYDEDLNTNRVIDICSDVCLEIHKSAVSQRWESDSDFRNWYGENYSLEQYFKERIRYNKLP